MLFCQQIAQIEELNKAAEKAGTAKEKEKKLKELLSKSFPVIKIKQLRPVRQFFNYCAPGGSRK